MHIKCLLPAPLPSIRYDNFGKAVGVGLHAVREHLLKQSDLHMRITRMRAEAEAEAEADADAVAVAVMEGGGI